MAAGGSRLEIEAFLTCGICMEPFRRPKILPCVHTFCCQCLKSYLSTSGAASRKKGGFPCPTCRQHVAVAKPSKAPETWPDQLKDNFVMSSMLEALKKQQQPNKSPAAAAAPPLSPSPTTPPDCGGSRPADGGPCTARSETQGCTCRTVPEVVCWDCALFMCVTCSVTAHAQCSQVQTISAAGPEKRQEMLDWSLQLHEQVTDLEGRHAMAQAFLHSLQARRQSTQEQISLAASDAIQMIRLQEQKLRQTMEKEFEVITKRYQQRQKASSAAIEDLKALKVALEQCVAERDVELLRQAQCLKQRYAAMTAPAEMTPAEDSEEGDQDGDTGTFVPASLTDLKSTVLVGVYHHGTDQSKTSRRQSQVTSAPTSPVTPSPTSPSSPDSASSCHLQDGPLLLHRPRCHSLPVGLTLPSSLVDLEAKESGPASTDEGTSSSSSSGPCSLSSPALLSGQRPVTCFLTHTFSARVKGDKAEPLIRDLVVLGNGWLVATDTANRCVKCYFKTQPSDLKYQCKRLQMNQAPYGVCSVEGHLVAVTVPKERQLLMVTARPLLAPLTTLTLPLHGQETAWAVSSLGEQRLAVTTCPQGEVGSVLILQVKGDSVQFMARYTSLVTTPLYIAVTSERHIVTTDPTSCHVACITSDTGHAVFHFHTNGKVMAVTSRPKLLLVVDQSPALSLLTNEGTCLHALALPKGKAGCSHPRAVAVATDSTVYVSDDSGKLHLITLKWQDPPAGT